ncbi:MAG: Lrp/AsnC ligand binding domain-containing protein [Nitrososphaerales archaeon]
MKEFLLISSARIKDYNLLEEIKKLEGVKEVYMVFGFEYDIVVKLEADSIKALRDLENTLARMKGVKNLLKFPIRMERTVKA